MALTILKWTAPLLLVVLAAALFTRKTFHVEMFVAASPAEVWSVLIDTENYPKWNPVFVDVDGEYREGATVRNSVRFPDGSTVGAQT